MTATCSTCMFFRYMQQPTVFKEADGRCHRYAPTGPAIQDGTGWSSFPPMFSGLWCGDYRPAPAVTQSQQVAA